jgi:hypothetical protein
MQYHIYDVVTTDGRVFSERAHLLADVLPIQYSIQCVETTEVTTQEELDELFDLYLTQGYEGQMVRTNALYVHHRTAALLKRKLFESENGDDKEFEIIGYKMGKGSRKGCIILKCVLPGIDWRSLDRQSQAFKDVTFDSTPKGPVEYLKRLWEARDTLLGMFATVKYQNLSSYGIPRFNNTIKFRDRNGEEIFI